MACSEEFLFLVPCTSDEHVSWEHGDFCLEHSAILPVLVRTEREEAWGLDLDTFISKLLLVSCHCADDPPGAVGVLEGEARIVVIWESHFTPSP